MRKSHALLFAFVVFVAPALYEPVRAQESGILDTRLLPFERPSRAELANSPRKVVAHWSVQPIRYYSYDRKFDGWAAAIDPTFESGKHFSAGGYVRNRPVPAPLPYSFGFIAQGAFLDIQLAAEIGVDAFMINCWYGPEDWRWHYELKTMFDAADLYSKQNDPGFSIAPNIDGHVMLDQMKSQPGNKNFEPEKFADNFARFRDRPSFLKVRGKHVIGVFAPERLPRSWYEAFRARLRDAHRVDVYLMAVFLEPLEREKYNGVFDAYSRFDALPYTLVSSEVFFRKWANDRGMDFVSGVSQSDDRPDRGITVESGGFQTEIATWKRAMSDNSQMAQIITWNDHYEGTNLRPNTGSQYAYYDVAAYYIAWYKTGVPPPIVRDVLYYAHRMHLSTAKYDSTKQRLPTTSKNRLPLEDKVYLLGFLKSGGTMQINVGGSTHIQTFGPGIHTLSAPLIPNDNPRFKLTIEGVTTLDFASAFNTRETVVWHDMYYRAGGSSRAPVLGVQNNLPEDRLTRSLLNSAAGR